MWKRTAITLFYLTICLSLTNCQQSRPILADQPESQGYVSYESPDNLIMNFTEAWRGLDIAEYRDFVLYDGEACDLGWETYEAFKFYFMSPSPEFGSSWGYDTEVERTAALFSGNPSRDGRLPGVDYIELDFYALGEWLSPTNPETVEGDRYPEGTLWCDYSTDMTITLKSDQGRGAVSAFTIRDTVRFYVIPVCFDGDTEYRLWKWFDLDRGK